MAKKFHIPKNLFMQTQRQSYRIATGAYYENNFIEVKYLYISQWNKNQNLTLVDNDPINEIKLINNNTAMFNFHGVEYVYSIESTEIADSIINNAVMAGSKIKGPFRFVQRGDGFILVRMNSALYKDILLKDSRQSMSKIKSKNFKVGGIYVTPGDKRYIYLGKVNSYFSEDYSNIEKVALRTSNKLFLHLTKSSNLPSSLNDFIKDNEIGPHPFHFKKSHSFVEKIGEMSVSDDIIHFIRDFMKKQFKKKIIDNSKDNWYIKHGLKYDYRIHCPLINMHDAKEKNFKRFDISQYLMMA